ncbi:hypothetical protein FA15DRAFT_691357 [Coprinopsis marcescibilis]|uniref:Uncharacterized protein n=1 Tax=Coprinopsis marcescibilis TaxID=230819 RepID=A0A5C3L8W8_COPMA|nr:hypothetical protein FA15DRAFT_691357 [Coprinopsis marcescibilis]
MVLRHSALINIKQGLKSGLPGSRMRPGMVDPSTADWIALSSKLSAPIRTEFLSVIQTLLLFLDLPTPELNVYCRKIISLIEMTRTSLVNQGIQVHLFCRCPRSFVAYKTAYVDVITKLKERRHELPSAVQERVRILVLPLSSNFTVQRVGDSPLNYTPLPRRKVHSHKSSGVSLRPSRTQQARGALLPRPIPPPDAFTTPSKKAINSKDAVAHRGTLKRIWSQFEIKHLYRQTATSVEKRSSGVRQPRSPARTGTRLNEQQASEAADENTSPLEYRIIRPLPRRFGIFCTGKTSMHGPNPAALRGRRTGSARPLE